MPDWMLNEVNGAGALDVSAEKLKQEDEPGKSQTAVNPEIIETEVSDNLGCIAKANEVASERGKLSDESTTSFQIESNGFALSGEDSISQERSLAENNNSCHFELNNAAQNTSNISFLHTDLSYGENDLSFYDWPEIDNFDDVDGLFSKDDSAFGQQQLEVTDQFPWLPCSADVYSSEAAMQTVVQSPYSDFDVLNDLADYDCPENNLISTADASAAVCENSLSSDYQFSGNLVCAAESKNNMNAWGKQACDVVPMGLSAVDQTCGGNSSIGYGHLDTIEGNFSPANLTGELAKQKSVAPSSPKLASSQRSGKRPLESTSSPSYITCNSYAENNSPFTSNQVSVSQGSQKGDPNQLDKKTGVYTLSIDDAVMVDHPGQQALTGVVGGDQRGKSRYCIERSEDEGKPLALPKVESDSSMVLDKSLDSSVSSNDSVEESSFRQLQNAISQLDVKTKLCIRDSLYRLARTVRQRQGLSTAAHENGESEDPRELHNAEIPGEFTEAMDVETGTNPIDRSIAMLLFHRPIDSFPGTADAASSLKSRAIDESNHVALDHGLAAMPAPLHSSRSPRKKNAR